MRRKQRKVTQQSSFRFFSSPFNKLAFLAPIFFSFAGHLVSFILVGIVFGKAFRILELDERKGRWIEKQDFHGNYRVINVTWFFGLFLQSP